VKYTQPVSQLVSDVGLVTIGRRLERAQLAQPVENTIAVGHHTPKAAVIKLARMFIDSIRTDAEPSVKS
jgi:hypothetical protein